jgi:putative ABC transport system permease protein
MLLGLTLGVVATRLANGVAQLPYLFDWPNAATALIVALVVNLLAALVPALHAAGMDPIEALRHE